MVRRFWWGRGSVAVGLALLFVADAVDSRFTRGALATERASNHLYFQRGLGNLCSRATNS